MPVSRNVLGIDIVFYTMVYGSFISYKLQPIFGFL